ncbi:MAG: BlaI/MecI/CopY family transcriptional regulator [Planctomycetes bacterium]|nr:BlaI/MecI/CopY family transcriptional regulator [Planctomycetota bacterium]
MPRPKSEHPTPGELEVLQIIWRKGPCTVRQVLDELNQSRPRAYTSVMSLLNVMTDKKLLRRKPDGRAFLYSARVEEQPTLREMVGDLVERAFGGSAELLVAHALEQTDLSPQQLEEIHRMIDEYRSRKEGT